MTLKAHRGRCAHCGHDHDAARNMAEYRAMAPSLASQATTTPNAPKAAAPAVAEALQLALNEERLKFQRETLRTSMMAAVLRGFIEKLQPEHEIGAWSRGCDLCVLVSEADALLKRPINAGPALAAAPQQVAEPVASGWISVEDRLPQEDMNCLISISGGRATSAVFRRGDFVDGWGFMPHTFRMPTHWQPLPAPPSQASATGEV